jgi:preprotein translocase SecE subunit
MNPLTYIKSVITETKLTTWPPMSQVLNLTLIIIVISIVLGFYIAGLDYAFSVGRNSLFEFINGG